MAQSKFKNTTQCTGFRESHVSGEAWHAYTGNQTDPQLGAFALTHQSDPSLGPFRAVYLIRGRRKGALQKCDYVWRGRPFKFAVNLESNCFRTARRAHHGAVPPPFPNRKLSRALHVLIHLKFITSRRHRLSAPLSHLFIDYFLMIFRLI